MGFAEKMTTLNNDTTGCFSDQSFVIGRSRRPVNYKLISVYLSIQLIADVYAKDIAFMNLQNTKDNPASNEKAMLKSNPTIPLDLLSSDTFLLAENNLFKNSKISDSSLDSLSLSDTSSSSVLNRNKKNRKQARKEHKLRRLEKKLLRRNSRNRRRRNTKGRHRHEGLTRRSCQTKSRYDYKEQAVDMFGDTVQVYPYIHIGSLSIDQYFYETFCDEEKCECSGIDNKRYKSSCETDYSFTYARVIKGGEIGWAHIKVRSGCSCVFREVQSTRTINIVDLI